MGYAERVLQPGETIAYRARLSWVIYFVGMVLVVVAIAAAIAAVVLKTEAVRVALLLAALIALFLGVFQITRAWLWQVNTEITVTNRRIIYKTGFISRNTVEMNLDKVESVLVRQSLLGRMLDFGTVIVRGVGAGLEPVDQVAAPLELHRHIGAPAA